MLELPDFTGTPWRGIVLSEKHEVWTLVDAEDFEWLSQWGWNISWGSGSRWKLYAKRNEGPSRATVRMHRALMMHHDPQDEEFQARHHVDHINGCALDNRYRSNLRWATPKQNAEVTYKRQFSPTIEFIVMKLLAPYRLQREITAKAIEEIPF